MSKRVFFDENNQALKHINRGEKNMLDYCQ